MVSSSGPAPAYNPFHVTGIISRGRRKRKVKVLGGSNLAPGAPARIATQPAPASRDQDRNQQEQEQQEEGATDQVFDDADDAAFAESPGPSDSDTDDDEQQQQQQHGGQARPDAMQQIVAAWSEQYTQLAFHNALQLRCKVEAERQQLQAAASDIRCLRCGPTHQGAGSIDVHIGTQLALHRIQVHNRRCQCQQQQPWLPSPIQFDCLGGNPAAYTLQGSTQGGALPLLFSRQLLADLDGCYQHLKGTSVYGYTQKLTEAWQSSCEACSIDPEQPSQTVSCQLPYKQDTIERRLSMALHLYRCFEQCLHQVVEQLPEWPLGPSRPCAACVPDQIHLHYDHVFSPRLLQRSGYTLDYQQPPNQCKIMCNADVVRGLAEADAAIKQTAASRSSRAVAAAATAAAAAGAGTPPDTAAAAAASAASGGGAVPPTRVSLQPSLPAATAAGAGGAVGSASGAAAPSAAAAAAEVGLLEDSQLAPLNTSAPAGGVLVPALREAAGSGGAGGNSSMRRSMPPGFTSAAAARAALAAAAAAAPSPPIRTGPAEAPGAPAATAAAAAASAQPRLPAVAATPAAAIATAAGAATPDGLSSTQPEVVPLSCSDFRADRLAARESARCLIKGLGVVVCRHGHIYVMLNCFEGERHAYALTALKHLVEQGVVPRVWWYDINCRWATSFNRWLQQQPDNMQALLQDLLLPIPPFHLFAHQSECKVKHGHLHMPGTGRGTGEVCEIVNSVLAPLGVTTKYMAPDRREAVFERIVHLRGRALDAKLAALLLEMLLRARQEQLAVDADISKMEGMLRTALMQQAQQVQADDVIDPEADLLQRMLHAVQSAGEQLQRRSHQLAMCWQGDYVRAYLVVQRHEAISGSTSAPGFHPPMSLLFPSAAVDSLKLNAAAVRASKANMRRIQDQHFGGRIPTISDPQVQLGISQWVAAAIGQQKERLETTIRHVQFLNSLVQPLATAREQSRKKKVLRQKQAMQQKAEAQLRELQAAVKWALALQQHKVVAAWQGDLGTELAALLTTTCQQLGAALNSTGAGGPVGEDAAGSSSSSRGGGSQGREGGAATGTTTVYTAEEAALRVHLLQLRKLHLEEEVGLVQKERQGLLSNLQQRIIVLAATLEAYDKREDDGAQDSSRDVTGTVYLLARELHRTTGLLATAEKLGNAHPDDAESVLAAAEAALQGEEAMPDTVSNDQP